MASPIKATAHIANLHGTIVPGLSDIGSSRLILFTPSRENDERIALILFLAKCPVDWTEWEFDRSPFRG